MEPYEQVYEALEKLDIAFDVVEHPAAHTTEEADRYIAGKEGVRTKTLFVCDKKSRNFYLVVMDDAKQLDMDKLCKITGEKRMKLCSAEKLADKMSLEPGTVSIFGLLNNEEKDIVVFLDKEILSQPTVTFHPNQNTKTIFLATNDMCRFIVSAGFEYAEAEL